MTAHCSGCVSKGKNVSHPDILATHSITHREHLAANKISPELHNASSDVIKIIE